MREFKGRGWKIAEALVWMERQTRASQEPTRESTARQEKS